MMTKFIYAYTTGRVTSLSFAKIWYLNYRSRILGNLVALIDDFVENTRYAISFIQVYIDGLVQEKRNSSALAMELRLSRTNSSIYLGTRVQIMHSLSPVNICSLYSIS